jgi:hypothetical protein
VVPYEATVTYTGFQGDVFQGNCEINSAIGSLSIPISGSNPNNLQGFVKCRFSVTVAVPTQLSTTITPIDRAKNRSNTLSFVLGIS